MVHINHPIWDQTTKVERKPGASWIRGAGPMLKTPAERRQEAEQEAEATAEEQKAVAALFAAAQKHPPREAAAKVAAKAGATSEPAASPAEPAASPAEPAASPAEPAAFLAEPLPHAEPPPHLPAGPAGSPGPAGSSRPSEATKDALHPQDPKASLPPGAVTQQEGEPASGTSQALQQESQAPKQKVQRRPPDLPLERRSIQAGYDVARFHVLLKDPGSQAPFTQQTFSQTALESVTGNSIPAAPRPQIVVCLQYPPPERGAGGTLEGRTKGAHPVDSAEARTAYVGDAIHFAEPLSISVAMVGGFDDAGVLTEEVGILKQGTATKTFPRAEAWRGAETWTAVLMPTRYAPRIPKLSHILALALRQQKEHSPQVRQNTQKEDNAQEEDNAEREDRTQKEELPGAFELTQICGTGADVFLFAPHPLLGPARRSSQSESDRLPDCPIPGNIRLLIPDLGAAGKSIQRKLGVFLVDLSVGAAQGDSLSERYGHRLLFPEAPLAKAVDFDWAALLEAGREEYKAAVAEQAQQVLQHVLGLRGASGE